MKRSLNDKLDNHRILLNSYYKTHYYSGQIVDMYDPAQKKYRKVTVITAGGGKVKISDNRSTYWIEADKIGNNR